jgi:hypothetical protein
MSLYPVGIGSLTLRTDTLFTLALQKGRCFYLFRKCFFHKDHVTCDHKLCELAFLVNPTPSLDHSNANGVRHVHNLLIPPGQHSPPRAPVLQNIFKRMPTACQPDVVHQVQPSTPVAHEGKLRRSPPRCKVPARDSDLV